MSYVQWTQHISHHPSDRKYLSHVFLMAGGQGWLEPLLAYVQKNSISQNKSYAQNQSQRGREIYLLQHEIKASYKAK